MATKKAATGGHELAGEGRMRPVGLTAANPGGFNITRKQVWLDYELGGVAPAAAAANVWIALCTGTFTAGTTDIATLQNGLTTEVTTSAWTNYARVQVANTSAGWSAATGVASTQVATKTNAATITFAANAAVTGTGPTPTFFAVMNSATLSAAANVIAVGNLTAGSSAVVNGVNVNFPAGSLTLTIT